jgi:hypothetical protein
LFPRLRHILHHIFHHHHHHHRPPCVPCPSGLDVIMASVVCFGVARGSRQLFRRRFSRA